MNDLSEFAKEKENLIVLKSEENRLWIIAILLLILAFAGAVLIGVSFGAL